MISMKEFLTQAASRDTNFKAARVEEKKRVNEAEGSGIVAMKNMIEDIEATRKIPNKYIALFNAYKNDMIPRLQEEKPGLTYKQYLIMVMKQWKISEKNPVNHGGLTKMVEKELRVNTNYGRIRKRPRKLIDL